MRHILILVASSNENMKLARKFSDVIQNRGHQVELMDLVKLDLPLFSPDQAAKEVPDQINELTEAVHSANAMIFIAPEYNKGIPPVLTNFISWISVSSGESWRLCFSGKPAAVGTHSGGGGLHVLMAMKMQLSEMGMNLVGRQIHTHFNKKVDRESLEEVVTQLIQMM